MPPSTDSSISDQEVPVPDDPISYVDDAVQYLLPGSQVTGIQPCGSSSWARTARIDTIDPTGMTMSYFIKVYQDSPGSRLTSGEFKSMRILWSVVPDLVPRPFGFGTYISTPDVHFSLSAFRNLSQTTIPSIEELPVLMADLHKRSSSENRKFGLPWEVHRGHLPMYFPPSDSWETTFSEGMEGIFEKEEMAQGQAWDGEMTSLRSGCMNKVIPRLLRPLEKGEDRIRPCLVHGDLWDGNCALDLDTGRPVIFDGLGLWAHNEYELGPWAPSRHEMSRGYIEEYKRHHRPSHPAEDFDDRILLYSLRFDLMSSALHPGNDRFRNIVKENLRKLVNKYPEGYEEWLRQRAHRTQNVEK